MQIDLLVNSFVNDMARVATLQYTKSVGMAHMNWLGIKDGHHSLSHEPDKDETAQGKLIKINQWFCSELSYLADKLAHTIRRVLNGEKVIDPDLAAAALADGLNPLTPRERDVLTEAGHGGTIAEIAAALYLSEGTVRNYLSACIQKTGARNRAEALRVAQERGWL